MSAAPAYSGEYARVQCHEIAHRRAHHKEWNAQELGLRLQGAHQ